MRYNEETRFYFEHPAVSGVPSGANACSGEAGSRRSGTWVRFAVTTEWRGAVLVLASARFLAFGCPHVIAVSSYVAQRAAGLPVTAALPESVAALMTRFAVPAAKRGRLLVIEDAWAAALRAVRTAPIEI